MTVRTKRRWQPEEKPAVIKEIQEKSPVVETCTKYSVDPTMYYKRKESYDTFGIRGLRSKSPLFCLQHGEDKATYLTLRFSLNTHGCLQLSLFPP